MRWAAGEARSARRGSGGHHYFKSTAAPPVDGGLMGFAGRPGMEYHYYWDTGWRLLEMQNGSDKTLKQYVWGIRHVDELVQLGVNTDPSTESDCEDFYYAMQNANFNVIGLADTSGELVERYEYTPYGRCTVYLSAFLCEAYVSASVVGMDERSTG